MTVWGFQNPG
ncbi:hypothetical protein LINPERPRIM_LOCUS234 [Linum perenne]